ncbi:MAG: hypothetical protein JRD88_11120 [Deltaproteobacteria bacterium]|jgi:hypothetical protein|nr:hypothetical protein [Deltaproteobacteria bacterium]
MACFKWRPLEDSCWLMVAMIRTWPLFHDEEKNRGNWTSQKAYTKPDVRVTVFSIGYVIGSTSESQWDEEKLQKSNGHGQVPFVGLA